MAMRRRRRVFLVASLVLALAAGGAYAYWRSQLQPTADGLDRWVRFDEDTPREAAFLRLENEGFIRNALVMKWFSAWRRKDPVVRSGTYSLRPGMDAERVLSSLERPVRQMVRLPEGWWIARTAEILEKKHVCAAADYVALAGDPGAFEGIVSFTLPKNSLEGYLYPDTYDLPPLLGARAVIERQLRAFEAKVVSQMPQHKDLARAVNIASMVELEAAIEPDRPMIAGVIENRIARKMTLDIDATVLYARQKWEELGPGIVRTVESPYNTYLNPGLPPGPIGSPSWRSIRAALEPAKHDFLFYVALPDRSHLFAKSYAEHRANIRKRRAALREASQ